MIVPRPSRSIVPCMIPFPDNLDYGLRFANAQIRADHYTDALQTVVALRKLPEPEGKDPRIDLIEASASERLGDMTRSQKAAAAGVGPGASPGQRSHVRHRTRSRSLGVGESG